MANTTQVKVTLSQELKLILKAKADRFGLSVSSYIKNMIINEVKNDEMPVFKMSEKREREGLKALEEHKAGNTIDITDNIDEYFDNI